MENVQRILKREILSLDNEGRLEEGKIYEVSGEKTEENVLIFISDRSTKKKVLIKSMYFPWEENLDHRSFKFQKTCFIYNPLDLINLYRMVGDRKVIAKKLRIS